MITHWIPLSGGLLLGLIPPRLLLNSECRYLRFGQLWNKLGSDGSGERRRRWWKLPLVWIDPVRGFCVGCLVGGAFEAVPGATAAQRFSPLLASFAVLLVVLWVQTSGRRNEGATLSPSAFLAGLMLASMPAIVAVPAIILGLAAAVAVRSFAAGYRIAALATAAGGYVFIGCRVWPALLSVLVAAPLLINWLRRTKLVMPVRC